jgi:large subunit ribosomal protein L22
MEKLITTVTLRNQRISPKKARLVMNLIKGKNASSALDILNHTDKKSADLALSLLKSAIDSAKNKDFKDEDLLIAESIAQEGRRMKRFFIRARGRSAKYQRRMSHLKISLAKIDDIAENKSKKKPQVSKPEDKKENNGKKS